MNGGEWVIEARGLGRRFRGRTVLAGVDLAVQQGEIFGLLGPDGAGKTTLMQMFATILDPSEGSCRVLGFDSVSEAAAVTARIGYMSQGFTLYDRLTVDENLAFPPLLTTLAIVREKESGSIEQIFASPLSAAEFIAGKLVPYGLVAFGQMLMVIAAGYLWFAVPFRGNLGFLLATALIYAFCTVSIGLLVSTVTRSQLAALLIALIITLMPSFLFSGFLFPLFTMPYLLQLYTAVFPGRYFVEVSRGIVLKGGGLETLWPNVLILGLYSLAVFWLATARFRKKVA